MYGLLKPLLFSMDPEKAHYFAMDSFSMTRKIPGMKSLYSSLFDTKGLEEEVELFGMKFPNRVGLAAGFDKDARYIDELSQLGFGFIEIGTLTPKAQDGNPKPRLFRIKDDQALINRMGFNNQGLEPALDRIRKRKSRIILGGNIGKNKVTPNENALEDYELGVKKLADEVDYFTLNLSSPNTPGLRDLQEKEFLVNLLAMAKKESKGKPVLVKIAPDMDDAQLDEVLQACIDSEIAGIIATNTTIDRNLNSIDTKEIKKIGAGGLSGKPLFEASNVILEKVVKRSGESLKVIASGGVFSRDDYLKKLDLGASLVQVYTGFIYEGPFFVKKLLKAG